MAWDLAKKSYIEKTWRGANLAPPPGPDSVNVYKSYFRTYARKYSENSLDKGKPVPQASFFNHFFEDGHNGSFRVGIKIIDGADDVFSLRRKELFHKFKHNFRDTLNPLCPTNDGVENTEHYFLLCHTYAADRLDLLNSVNAILLLHGMINLSNEKLLKIILYGNEQLPFDSNAKILTATLEYIQASKRFE